MFRSHSSAASKIAWAILLAVVLTLGCASPGPPRAPSLHLPGQASKLDARRVGDDVLLSWVTPANTTDGDKVRDSMTAVVCREVSLGKTAAGKKAASCDAVRRLGVSPGTSSVVETLPANLDTGAPTLLAYRVELLNEHGRSAGRSDAAFAAGGEAPPAVGPLTISARRESALIRWQPQSFAGTMELKRTLTATADGPFHPRAGAAETPGPPARKPAGALKNQGLPSLGGAKPPAGEVTLRAALVDGNDPGGVSDRTVRDQDSYTYVAQRVRTVTLDGHELELRGVASPPASFIYRDIFPPKAPAGLVSVPGGGFGVAASIELSWEPNAESDLLGYNVYRRDGSGAFDRLNAEPVPSSAFRDMRAEPGHAYTYRVTAVDQRHNESAPSDEIHESLRK